MSCGNSLRLSGPLNVSATPNRAVRVGKTQSACATMRITAGHRMVLAAHHVNTQSDADEKIWLSPAQ